MDGTGPGPAETQVEKAVVTPVRNDYTEGLTAGIALRSLACQWHGRTQPEIAAVPACQVDTRERGMENI